MSVTQVAVVAALLLPIALAAVLVTLVVIEEATTGTPANRKDVFSARARA